LASPSTHTREGLEPIGDERDKSTGLPRLVRDRFTGIEMVLIPAGEFEMGRSPGDEETRWPEEEGPRHVARITRPFYLSIHEVTRGDWCRVMGEDGESPSDTDLPVELWCDEADSFARKTRLRLPTEAEWEYACRAGTTGSRYGDVDEIAWYNESARSGDDWDASRMPHPVGLKKPNVWGLHDMLGNVGEWCSTSMDGYSASLAVDPAFTPPRMLDFFRCGGRVIRGGCIAHPRRLIRASMRSCPGSDAPMRVGFRVAADP